MNTPHLHATFGQHPQRGASLLEAMVAAVILLVSLGATFSYISSATLEVKGRSAAGESSDLQMVLRALTRSVIESEAKTDPCLKSKTFETELAKRYGSLSDGVQAAAFDSSKIGVYNKFLNGSASAEWKNAFSFCTTASGQNGCVLLDKPGKGVERKRLALGIITRFPYDFSIGKAVDPAACDNAEILKTETADGAGIGIKATYILLSATTVGAGDHIRIVTRKSVGETYYTSAKQKSLGGQAEYDPSISPSCQQAFCAGQLAPDPGKDYAAWQKFPKGEAWNASFCGKCERSPTFK